MINIEKILVYRISPFIPVIQLLLSGYSAYSPLNWFDAGNTIGYSMLCSFVYFVYFFYRYDGKRAYISWVSSIGLFGMNYVSWLGSVIGYDKFAHIYDISIICVSFFVILWIGYINYVKENEYIKIFTPK